MDLFELLNLAGIDVPSHLRQYPYFITWDCEAILIRTPWGTDKTRYTFRHELVSISICSNVPGFVQPVCLIRDNTLSTYDIVKDFIKYICEIGKAAEVLMQTRLELYTQELDDEILEAQFDTYMKQIPVIGKYILINII